MGMGESVFKHSDFMVLMSDISLKNIRVAKRILFISTTTIKMKTLVLLAVLIGVVCITYSTATPYSSNQEKKLISSLVQQLSSRESVVEKQEDDDNIALAQVYLRLLENEVQKQDMSDEDRAEMESISSKLRNKFKNFRNKIAGGFRKFKNFFHRG